MLDRYRVPEVRLRGIRVLRRGLPAGWESRVVLPVSAEQAPYGYRVVPADLPVAAGDPPWCWQVRWVLNGSAGATGRPLDAAAGGADDFPTGAGTSPVLLARACGPGMVPPDRGEQSG
ncbi:hypothetical protein GCM10009554_58600 [Kribbella koreensis]|uniref:Uncharacterized protein n=1 Tax=Kribbella koreensis TaxID=57909 RepID=A0ABP4BSP6_9ACTN